MTLITIDVGSRIFITVAGYCEILTQLDLNANVPAYRRGFYVPKVKLVLRMDHRESDEHRINEALGSSDITAICDAIGETIRRNNITDIAKTAGLKRTSIYRAFGGRQSPNLSTVIRCLDALGLQFNVVRRPGRQLTKSVLAAKRR
jgi:probable addiction module antidote protein